jgi:predicted phosphodiesterase
MTPTFHARTRRATAVLLGASLLAAGTVGTALAGPGSARPAAHPDTRGTDDVLYRQGFDSLADDLLPRAEDPGIEDGVVGFTHTAPKGWSVRNGTGMADGGVEEWRGWSFTTRDFWTDAEDQMRYRFARAQDVIAVADSDEFADAAGASGPYATTLASAPVKVKGRDQVELTFDSHYRGWAGQTGRVTVAFDGGAETELVRYDSSTVTDNYDGALMNATETVPVDVPRGAKRAVFRWHFTAGANSWYWAIDSVAVRAPLPRASGDPTTAWVLSDIQGDPDDLGHALRDLDAVRPDPDGLLMVGDIVASGSAAQWQEVDDVMTGAADVLPEQVVAAIGNHESYTGESWETLRDRFLDFAERDRVWDEYVLRGSGGSVPVLVLGQEAARPPEVPMSREQVEWLRERLAYWSARDKQVLVISHFPLGDTVSASWIPWYSDSYQYNDELTELLGDHPNAILFSGHTHYPFELGDWAVQRRTAGGHPDGFWTVNTGAVQVEWDARGESTSGIEEVVTRDVNRGLTVDVFRDRVVVDARDFGTVDAGTPGNTTNDVVRSVTIPNPLTK